MESNTNEQKVILEDIGMSMQGLVKFNKFLVVANIIQVLLLMGIYLSLAF